MARQLTPAEVRDIAEANRIAADPACHLWAHGFSLADAIVALRHCFRVQNDPRLHGGKPPSGTAYRADCRWLRNATLRIDFNLAESANGDVILVVTGFIRENLK